MTVKLILFYVCWFFIDEGDGESCYGDDIDGENYSVCC